MTNYIRRYFIILILLSYVGCSTFEIFKGENKSIKYITPDVISEHLFFLASDSLKGRNTPSSGLDTAAEYIAKTFARYGLDPVKGGYFQQLKLEIVNLGDSNHLIITKMGKETEFKIKTDFTPFEMTADTEITAPLVFAGYGIKSEEYNYNDYENLDVRGKIVLVMRHEPGEEDSSSIFEGKKSTDYSNVIKKVQIAIEQGAVGVLVVTDPLNHTSLTPRGFPWPSLSKIIPADALPLRLATDEPKVPVVQVGENVIEQLLGSVDTLRVIQQKIDSTHKPYSFEFKDVIVNLKTTTIITEKSSRNVLGFIEGSDPILKNEVIIIGAHYDHIGYRKGTEAGNDSIFNGADDNASGTSGLLAIAKAFGASGKKTKRSVLFIAFAGEEKGLLGSSFYVRNPIIPLDKTIAMLNMDMIGRNHEDSVYIIGASHSPDILKIVEEENKNVGFTLVTSLEKYMGGSDHAIFYRKGIPILFFFTGEHEDYHKVTDHPELINTKKVARIAQLVYRTAWHMANENKYYKLTK